MRITVNSSTGKVYTAVINSNRAVIGRSSKAELIVEDEALSRNHCLIEFNSGSFFITDLGSANGVYIDSLKIETNTRTPFQIFSLLSLAGLSCTVEDTELLETSSSQSHLLKNVSTSSQSKNKTKTNKVNVDNNKKSLAKRKYDKGKSPYLGFITPVLLLIGIFYYAFISPPEKISEKLNSSPGLKIKNKAEAKAALLVADEFKNREEYLDSDQKKSCVDNQRLCENLHLDSNNFEGVFIHEGEVFVYMNPYLRQTETKYQMIKESKDYADLIVIDAFLSSEVLDQYLLKKFNQAHLVINNSTGEPEKVYRFHPSKFIPGKTPRLNIINELILALQTGKTDKFMSYFQTFVMSKSLISNN